ncbi:MAG: hypothetical protein AVO34_12720 [Firmicutes bacterium ML8_F2]|nr:MAG: hypothetical protein AVO34_12720 [Firmicutes bacterium ML8_F2]
MEKIKRERLEFVDLARGMAVIFMIAVHVLMVYANNTVKESPFGVVVEFLGGPPAAPVCLASRKYRVRQLKNTEVGRLPSHGSGRG